ncbi:MULTISPECIES: hypothetical protein [Streptomyces]|uniref:hypothetical protein n=1 Tax=Streptomyces TaxID=1883 RepID=UPI0006AD50C1|nr:MULTISPECIES: hypothetical protein [Streptomyces]ALC26924.1 hypothetical protein ABE83_07335 [Streptomyces sp. CFMR 7]RZF06991.1 hypothetical protein C0R05_19100 [Streptomyces albidoflavus]
MTFAPLALPPPPAALTLERRLTIRSLLPPRDAQAARIQALTCMATFGWPDPLGLAVATVDHLVRNASQFGRCADKEIGLRIARTEADDLLIDVTDHNPEFPSFEQAAAGFLGKGLWRIAQYGGVVSWHPHECGLGKTVRAVLRGDRS